MMTAPDRVRASRIKLALIFLLPVLAVGFATLVYYTGVGIPRGTTNKGVLMQPPRQIDEIDITAAAGEVWRHEKDAPGWGLLVVGAGECAETCRERLYLTRQIRIALGLDAERVTRFYLQLDGAPGADFSAFAAAQHPDLRVLRAGAGAVQGLLGRQGDPDPVGEQPIYVIDPRGFVMMYYLSSHAGKDTIADLRFLLKYSNEKGR
jgi:hypothetical protein